MPPSNTTPETAVNITSLPFTVTQDVTGAPPTPYTSTCHGSKSMAVWYKYTAAPGITAIGMKIDATNRNGNYFPILSIFTGNPPTLTQYSETNRYICLPNNFTVSEGTTAIAVIPGNTYYFLIINADDSVVTPNASLILSVLQAPSATAPAGTLVVSNDRPGGPTGFISSVDGTLISMIGFPSFECAEVLLDGTLGLMAEPPTNSNKLEALRIYDKDFQLKYSVTSILSGIDQSSVSPLTSNRNNTFYCIINSYTTNPSNSTLYKISSVGVVLNSWNMGPFSQSGVDSICVNLNETIAYFGYMDNLDRTTNKMGRWDLVNGVRLTDSVVLSPPAGAGRDLIYLSTNELIWPVEKEVKRYNASGTLLATYGPFANLAGSPNRICRALDDPLSFWVMHWPNGGHIPHNTRFQNIRISDGAVLKIVETPLKGLDDTYTSLQFGISQSCPLIMTLYPFTPGSGPVEPPAPDRSGIYFLNPTITRDKYYTEDKKIPDPTIKTALIGE